MKRSAGPSLVLLASALLASPAWAQGSAPSSKPATPSTPYQCGPRDQTAALNNLLAAGGDVELAAGVCRVSAGLAMTVPGTTLNGAGATRNGTVITALSPATGYNVLTLGEARKNYHGAGMTVSNLVITAGITSPPGPKVGQCLRVEGNIYADLDYAFGAHLTDIQVYNCASGINISGSDILGTRLNSHGNQYAAIYVAGVGQLTPPHNLSSNVRIIGGKFWNSELADQKGQTWDTVNWSRLSSNGTFGGLNPGEGNLVQSGDVLIGCDPDTTCTAPIDTFLVQGNTVEGRGFAFHEGIRLYGFVNDGTVDSNVLIGDNGTGITLRGTVLRAKVSGNTVSGFPAYSINLDQLPGYAPGDSNTLSGNVVTPGPGKHIAVRVSAHTNVSILNNQTNGGLYLTVGAGAGLTVLGNQ